MTPRDTWDSDYGDEPYEDDPEGPQECDLEADGDSGDYGVVPCPHCGAEVSELTQQCPYCGDWIVPSAGAHSGWRTMWVVLAILLLLSMLWWVF